MADSHNVPSLQFTGRADIEASLAALDRKPISRWYGADLERYDALHKALERKP